MALVRATPLRGSDVPGDQTIVAQVVSDEPVRFTAKDFGILVQTFRRRRRDGVDVMLGACFVGILLAGYVVASAGERRGWSSETGWLIFAGMWAIGAAPLLVGSWRTKRL